MPQRVSVKEAEAIRTALKLDHYQFSTKIGFSPTAYYKAIYERKRISPYMSFRIMMHCQRQLAEVRE